MIKFAVVLLFGDAQSLKYRPPEGTVPWHNSTSSEPSWSKPDWKVDYVVPNFGPDHDIAATHKNIADSEKRLGHKMKADFKATENKLNPRDYFVPNFGLDKDIEASLKNLSDTEKKHGKWVLPPTK